MADGREVPDGQRGNRGESRKIRVSLVLFSQVLSKFEAISKYELKMRMVVQALTIC